MSNETEDQIKQMERWLRGKTIDGLKAVLRWKILEGKIKRQSALEFAAATLGRRVTVLEDLTEGELELLKTTLIGGKRSV